MIVFPRAGVHRAATQANDDGQMLDADGALVFAGAAGGALEVGVMELNLPIRVSGEAGPNSLR